MNDLGYVLIKFPVSKIDNNKYEKKNKISMNIYFYKNNLVYKRPQDFMDLKLIADGNKSHYLNIRHFGRFIYNNTKRKNRKHFPRYCCQCFSGEKVLIKHKKVCLKINGKQSIKFRSGSIKFKNNFKQLAVPFKIYSNFECV